MQERLRCAFGLAVLSLLFAPALALARPLTRVDLIVDANTLNADWTVGFRAFQPGDCDIAEACIGGPGVRKLLVFSVETANISMNDFVLGDPVNNPLFVYSPCHGHYHLEDFSDYQLLDGGGSQVGAGHKQGWCLIDGVQYVFQPWVPTQSFFGSCDMQGLSRGWSDTYFIGFECQWIDVTGIPPGSYQLRAIVNSARKIRELDYSNDTATVPVVIPDLSGDPDLALDPSLTSATMTITKKLIAQGDPLIADGCYGGTGYRKLLTFGTRVANVAPDDLFLGDPNFGAHFEYVPAHGHSHLKSFIEYQLFDLSGNPATAPAKQERWFPGDSSVYVSQSWVRPGAFYGDNHNFGIQRGWSASVAAGSNCQWIDVTGVPNGPYQLRVTLNPTGAYPESNLSNNSFTLVTSVAEPAQGIAHRPDGSMSPGTPLTVEPAPGGLRVNYDVTTCPASNYNLYYSFSPPSAHLYTLAVCGIGTSGSAVVDLPNPPVGHLLWFLLVGVEGGREGGHGFDSAGRERPLSGVGMCGITESLPVSGCIPIDP